jgi:hypothetical protein
MERPTGRHAVDHLDGANLDDTMAAQRVEPGCLGIDDDFTHGARLSVNRDIKALTCESSSAVEAIRD